jgi:hypothetical protein
MEAERFFNNFVNSYFISLKKDDNVREKFKAYYNKSPFWFEKFVDYLEDDFYEELKYYTLEEYDEEIWENVIYPIYYDKSKEIEAKLRDFAENLYKELVETIEK